MSYSQRAAMALVLLARVVPAATGGRVEKRTVEVRSKPVVMEHAFGSNGSGGVYTCLLNTLASPLADEYRLVPMVQNGPAGGLNTGIVREFVQHIREVRPDLVHVRGLGNEGFHAALASRLSGVDRLLVSVHGTHRDLESGPKLRRKVVALGLEPMTLRLATKVATVSEAAGRRSWISGLGSKYAGTVPNGVSMPALDPAIRPKCRRELGVGKDDFIIIYVGRLTFDKGPQDLVRALGGIAHTLENAPKVLFVGEGPMKRELESLAALFGVSAIFLGQRANVTDWLQCSDLYVHPSHHENLSFALLEAMSAGLPCVASAVGGNVEVLARGGGTLVAAADLPAMGSTIRSYVLDAQRRTNEGNLARKIASQTYSLDAMADGWKSVYESMLTLKGR